jgi:hypothetical protein
MIAILAVIAVAAFGIMVVIGASVLESENAKRHPPDDDGRRKDEQS